MSEKLAAAKQRLLEPTLIGPKLNYIALLATAVGVDLGVTSSLFLAKLGPALEIQRLMPLNELTCWVPAKIGLVAAIATAAGKALTVALTEPKKEEKNRPSRPLRLAWQIPAALVAAKLLGTEELLKLPANLFSRPYEPKTEILPEEQYTDASVAIAETLTAAPNLDQTMIRRLSGHALSADGVQSFIRFAQVSAVDFKRPEQSLLDYFKDDFLPKISHAAAAAKIHPYTLAGMVHYAFLVNQNQFNHNADIFQEMPRLIFGSINSVTKRKLTRTSEDLLSLAQFLAFPIQGVYGPGRTGAMNLIRENNEPTIGWQDMKITEIARGILAWQKIKPGFGSDYPESVEAAQNLEDAWQKFDRQRTAAAEAIDALVKTAQDQPLFKRLLAEKPDWHDWEDLGFSQEQLPWHTTHLTQTWKYYVELELEGLTAPEDIGLTAMYLAIKYFGETVKQSGKKEAVRQLLVSQFEDKKFWQALAKKLPEHKQQINRIRHEAKKLQPLGQNKRDAVAEAHGIFAGQENNPDWQVAVLTGTGAHFINNLNQFPLLKKLVAEEPLWQMYCVMPQRELSPANLYVKRDKYPLVTDIDLSSDPENVLRRLDFLIVKLEQFLGHPTAAELLKYMVNYDLGTDPAQVKPLYEDLFGGRAWSGIKVANNEYFQMTAVD